MTHRILVINPGSTSTKISVFHGEEEVFTKNISHPADRLAAYPTVGDQYLFRLQAILELLSDHNQAHNWHAIVGRGGFMRPIPSGIYRINDLMLEDLRHPVKQHASNLGALIAYELAGELRVPSFVVDPVVVDEMQPVARISGYKGMERKSFFHPLNHKATARKLAEKLGKRYEDGNFIIVHMGGGVTVGAHQKGAVVDVNNGADGEGPFSSERSGTLPVGDVISMCYSGDYTEGALRKEFMGKGGMVSYLGTNDLRQVEAMANGGDGQAALLMQAFSYQVAKDIGAMAAVLKGEVDAVGLTGGVAYSKPITGAIADHVAFIAPVHLFPGESEMESMAMGAIRVLRGEAEAKEYAPEAASS